MPTVLVLAAALVGATVLAALVFGLLPGIDLAVAGLFYRGSTHFVGDAPLGSAVRKLFYWVPTGVLLGMVGLYALRRFGQGGLWAPSGRGVLFLVISFAIGPGLIANTLLKDHSHRPRPYQTTDFGGDEPFRPFYRFDGACRRNCSFVSGEGATSAWTLGAALLVPPPWRAVAIAASLAFALASGGLRMAFGGHYFSDAVFAVVFSWWVLWAAWLVFRPRRPAVLPGRDAP